ncbi:ATP synthase F1 subunit delta [Candidatus Sumerlaeota bacterium]|nr:ATP synthase F1 subunit delta [Candidatus Sumerlaeales bacterium]NLD61756.1 ATP synthase F1 subunit delta [Candidatus Sumerlaeota bacterium]
MSSGMFSGVSPILVERYAQALFDLALENNALVSISDDISNLRLSEDVQNRTRVLFESPRFTDAEKEDFIRRCFTGNIHPILLNFMLLVLKHDRMLGLSAMLTLFVEKVSRYRGIWRAELVSAVPLTDNVKQIIDQTMEAYMRRQMSLSDSEPLNLSIDFKVDERMIGGLRFMCGNILLDDTVRGKLDRTRTHLMTIVRQ